jgi:c-di-GMP-binding flagellar brake protein YcgR
LRRFRSKVAETLSNPIPILVLTGLEDLGTLQRRQHARLSERLTVRYRIHKDGVNSEPWLTARTSDMSAGGLQMEIVGDDRIRVGDILEIELSVPGEKTAVPLGRVVRVIEQGSHEPARIHAGLHFTDISAREEDIISRYVFRRQSELRDIRRRFARLRVQQPIRAKYRPAGKADAPWRQGSVHDIGLGGIRLHTDDIADVAGVQRIEVCLEMPNGHTITTDCQVIRAIQENTEGGESYQIGIKFGELDEKARAAIQEFLTGLEGGAGKGTARAA